MLFKPITLGIVDDHALFRKALKNYLSEQKNISVSIQASDIFELFSKLKDTSVDVLLMDVFMPEVNRMDALKAILNKYPGIKILLVSASNDMGLISDLLDYGIYGYISKADEPEDLLQAIITASENRIYRNKLFTEAMYWKKQNNIGNYTGRVKINLDERERKILKLIWEEKSNKEIAGELFLGIRSIEKIRQNIKEKIGAKSIVGLLKYALNKKII
jgi:DNA-binding NarL/FixJ family response regulator